MILNQMSKLLISGLLLVGSVSFGAAIVPPAEDSKQPAELVCDCGSAGAFITALELRNHIVDKHFSDVSWTNGRVCRLCNVTYSSDFDAKAHHVERHFQKPSVEQALYLATLKSVLAAQVKMDQQRIQQQMGWRDVRQVPAPGRGTKRSAPSATRHDLDDDLE